MGQAHYFLAVELPERIKNVLSDWAQGLDKLPFDYKEWVDERDYHLTVKFLGAVSDSSIEPLCKAVQTRVKDLPSFNMQGAEWGFFGSSHSPRVLWAGVQEEAGLFELQKMVEEIGETFGFPRENRPYRPHITIAKKWIDGQFQPSDLPPLPNAYKEVWKVEHFVLYKIHPSRTPKYEKTTSFDLRCNSNIFNENL